MTGSYVLPEEATPRGRGLHARSATELQEILAFERRGGAFVIWRDVHGDQSVQSLPDGDRVTIGRRSGNDIVLAHDSEVSRAHAELAQVGGAWTLTDDGLSRNGTFVNGTRITQRRRLADGDMVRVGQTLIEFRCPSDGSSAATSSGTFQPTVDMLTDAQRRVLIALCRPYRDGGAFAAPASNNQIAAEVFLGLDAVKNHLRTLFARFEISPLPQNQKRARLVECAFRWGLVSERDL